MLLNGKKKLIVFDLDGVLFNSISNMKVSWQYTNNIFKLNIDFKEYAKHLGLLFLLCVRLCKKLFFIMLILIILIYLYFSFYNI